MKGLGRNPSGKAAERWLERSLNGEEARKVGDQGGILQIFKLKRKRTRNCLAGDEPPPGDSCYLVCSGFLEEEPPGGTFSAARRRKASYLFSGFADEEPGGTGSGDPYRGVRMINSRYNHLIEGLNEWNSEYELGLSVCYQKSRIGMNGKMAEHLVAGGVWEIPELTHRLAARSWPPSDVGDSAEGVLVVIERVLSVSRSLV
ncbi:hypothetical protein DEO72_LG6g2357 [Vigna unguiculata]|uniref:Uncharacterized protein n=1 Tax=Vigna unguiculata TaxID=3917 RepID=A0A4D6MC50_VIGUN|nr:hypothetical protein DEO72_LG6g2357 [Vigna unguiculata]